MRIMTNGGSTAVELSPHHPKVKGSSLAVNVGNRICEKTNLCLIYLYPYDIYREPLLSRMAQYG